MANSNVEPLYDGDQRIERVVEGFQDVVERMRNQGITVATMIGCMEIVKAELLKELLEE